jgi:chromosome segregation ATPase
MLKQAVEILESENADLRAQVARLANDCSESLALLNVAQSANAELALLAKSYREEYGTLAEIGLGRLRAEIADLKRDFNSMSAAREVTMTERDQARAKIATLKASNDALQTHVADRDSRIAELESANAELVLLAKSYRGEIKSLNAATQRAIDALKECQSENATLKAANVALTAGICGGCKAAKAQALTDSDTIADLLHKFKEAERLNALLTAENKLELALRVQQDAECDRRATDAGEYVKDIAARDSRIAELEEYGALAEIELGRLRADLAVAKVEIEQSENRNKNYNSLNSLYIWTLEERNWLRQVVAAAATGGDIP